MSLKNGIRSLLEKILGTATPPEAYSLRVNGKSAGMQSSPDISVTPREGQSGIVVHVRAGARGQVVHVPAVVDESGVNDLVYNDFYIGEGAQVDIVAGCGLHNDGTHLTRHDGIHTFHIGAGAEVRYTEKHYGEGTGTGERVLNPQTVLILGEGSSLEMDTVQIGGVDSTRRVTRAELAAGAHLTVREKLMTDGTQEAVTEFHIALNGADCGAHLISRSVAKGHSRQTFLSEMSGNNACAGHSECDAIIMDDACVRAVPEVCANHVDAALIHEAAIGKIAGEQITKLMTLGLSRQEAEQEIIEGFLK